VGNDALFDDEAAAPKSLSATRLKKLALGQHGYKDISRDYDSTLSQVDLNRSQSIEWGEKPANSAKIPPSRPPPPKTASSVGQATGSSSTATTGPSLLSQSPSTPSSVLSTDAARAIPRGSIGVGGKVLGPPPLATRPPQRGGPSNVSAPPSSSTIATAATNHRNSPGTATRPGLASSYQSVTAPSSLPPPIAALEAPPDGYVDASTPLGSHRTPDTNRRKQSQTPVRISTPVRPTHIAPTSSTSPQPRAEMPQKAVALPNDRQAPQPVNGNGAPGSKQSGKNSDDDDDEDEEDDNEGVYDWTAFDTAEGMVGMAEKKGANTPLVSNGDSKSSQQSPSQQQQPQQQQPPAGGGGTAGRRIEAPPNIPIRPFPKTDEDENLYATFGAGNAAPLSPRRPSRVPSLSIAVTPTPTQPQYKIAPPVTSNTAAASTPQRPKPDIPTTPSSHGQQLGTVGINPTRPQPPGLNQRGAPPSTAGTPTRARPAPPPRAGIHAVKETKDVKRNKAQIPSTLTHAVPTTGDWLKKRYIVNNYILLDTLGNGSYGEVSEDVHGVLV
jgi:hypothetical protein